MTLDDASRERQARGLNVDWDLNLKYGEQGQLFVEDIISAIEKGSIEVKRDARWHETGRFYVEYECLKASGWEKSGIATTKALLWAVVYGDTEAVTILPTALLKVIVREMWKQGHRYRKELTRGSHPTRGVVIPLEGRNSLHDWLARYQRDVSRGTVVWAEVAP